MDEGSEATRDWADATHPPAAGEVRIACLVPSLTELLFALDLGDRVVARTGFCVHPREGVRRIPKIGGTKDPDLALLRRIAPTHLIVNVDENRREDVDAARAFVPRIIVTHPQTPADNHRLFRLFGGIFDRRALDGVKQHGRLNDNHLGRLDGDDCRRLRVHVAAPVNG